MFKSDSTLLIQIQLALIGIVVVVGLFYLWRIITRLEERVNKSLCKCNNNSNKINLNDDKHLPSIISKLQTDLKDNENNMEELQNAEELMKQVFGGDIDMNQPTMVMFSMESLNQMPDRSSGVIVEELNNLDNENKTTESIHKISNDHDESDNSETNDDNISIDINPMSKSKLSQMKLEKLRALCKARDLPTEGLKPQLIERLLGLSRE